MYTDDVNEQDTTYNGLLPSSLKDVWGDQQHRAIDSSYKEPGPLHDAHVEFSPPSSAPSRAYHPHYPGSAPSAMPFSILDVPAAPERDLHEQLPQVGAVQNFFSIQFHPNRIQTYAFRSNNQIGIGDYVITDADRGYDIGRVIAVVPHPNQRDAKAAKNILRKAEHHEIAQLPMKEERERNAQEVCQNKARELNLPMEITGAEFQFDGKKLTFYYKATKYVDFRNLVKALFRIFGTRIWMVWFDGSQPVRDVLTRYQDI